MGKSLTNIRILNDLSRNQLAEKIGVTEQAIWQYENGYMSPKLEVVNKLKTIFRVKSTYFYNHDLLNGVGMDNIQVENIAYRSETINSLNKSQSESMHVRFIDAFIRKIETRINYPKNIILELRNEAITFLKNNDDMDRNVQIDYIASMAREKIGLNNNSNQNLLFLLEKAGIFVFEKEIGETIDAYSLWSKEERPYIMLGTIKKSEVRRNFDLAHELGHLLIHYKVEFTMQDKKTYKSIEDEANSFASAFLLPEVQFRKDCSSIVKRSNPDAYIDIKQKWQVSLQAIAMRAFKLNIIDYQQYRYFYIKINQNGYKVVEPLDRDIPISRPTKVKSILQLLFDKGLYTVSEIMDEFKVDQSFLTLLTGIENDFFERHRQNENKKFSVKELGFKTN
ncbi:ImmA/IrrE family metallo-endopeptidase [Psychrobacillus sp. NEAU-3TGS]|uniref:spr1629 family repressor/antitoxin n=1 Tax=Psychrobacillus sp. NEAU-3TGS TaxID=2995412 RepID=UPI00249641DD|nr:ImmA/IrrE family metallo-endopeptidase [Psychrobacillus sp. NEAU-3TGS]MDI2588065.1 ImmA/IrrE family metallo-endopeptidase [Psychrobacillus sp. NEAU-3TGS]